MRRGEWKCVHNGMSMVEGKAKGLAMGELMAVELDQGARYTDYLGR